MHVAAPRHRYLRPFESGTHLLGKRKCGFVLAMHHERRGFAFHEKDGDPYGRKGLGGRAARVVVSMGMPALVYQWTFRAHSVKSLERNI